MEYSNILYLTWSSCENATVYAGIGTIVAPGLKEHSTKNILRCKQETLLTLGYLRSLKGQFFLGKKKLLIEVCKIPCRTTPCCLSQADA